MAKYIVLKTLYSKSAQDYIYPGDEVEFGPENAELVKRFLKNGRIRPKEIKKARRRLKDGTDN